MAWECSEHAGYHINMDTALVEVIDENGRKVKAGQKREGRGDKSPLFRYANYKV